MYAPHKTGSTLTQKYSHYRQRVSIKNKSKKVHSSSSPAFRLSSNSLKTVPKADKGRDLPHCTIARGNAMIGKTPKMSTTHNVANKRDRSELASLKSSGTLSRLMTGK